jgi:hypothetical protein
LKIIKETKRDIPSGMGS